jgi:hypothetical protein
MEKQASRREKAAVDALVKRKKEAFLVDQQQAASHGGSYGGSHHGSTYDSTYGGTRNGGEGGGGGDVQGSPPIPLKAELGELDASLEASNFLLGLFQNPSNQHISFPNSHIYIYIIPPSL